MVLNCRVCLLWMALCGLVWHYMALCGPMWYRMVLLLLCDLVCSCMAFYGLLIVFYCILWSLMCNGRISSFLAVIDPNSFGLVLHEVSLLDLRTIAPV